MQAHNFVSSSQQRVGRRTPHVPPSHQDLKFRDSYPEYTERSPVAWQPVKNRAHSYSNTLPYVTLLTPTAQGIPCEAQWHGSP